MMYEAMLKKRKGKKETPPLVHMQTTCALMLATSLGNTADRLQMSKREEGRINKQLGDSMVNHYSKSKCT